jgi:hypothetical protein
MDDDTGLGKDHPCLHRRCEFTINMVHSNPYTFQNTGAGSVVHAVQDRWVLPKDDALQTGYSSGWVSAPYTALPPGVTLIPPVANEAKIINDVWEDAHASVADALLNLIEGHQLIPSINAVSVDLAPAGKQWPRLRKVLKRASAATLAVQFGIKPLLNDMSSVWSYTDKLAQDLRRFEKGDVHRVSRQAIVEPTTQIITTNTGTRRHTVLPIFRVPPTYRYVLRVKPIVPYKTRLFTTLDLLARRLSTGPATLAWEVTPFSFLFDWFVDIRGLLMTLDNAVRREPFKVVGATRSLTYEVSNHGRTEALGNCYSGQVLAEEDAGSVMYRHYERQSMPQQQLVAWNPKGTASRLTSAIALLTQSLTSAKRFR